MIAKSDGIPPLITLLKKSSSEAQQHAACALWHLASLAENRAIVVEAGGIKPLISMLAADDDTHNELAAVILVRLSRGNSDVSVEIAEKSGVLPLVRLLSDGSRGSQQQAAGCLTELALVSRNRDIIANAGGIDSTTKLLSSTSVGTPEVAARLLAHLAYQDTHPLHEPGEEPSPRGARDARLRRAARQDVGERRHQPPHQDALGNQRAGYRRRPRAAGRRDGPRTRRRRVSRWASRSRRRSRSPRSRTRTRACRTR